MRATRAYLASLGTTGLLLLAALAVGVTAGTLIGFDAWPGQDQPAKADRVVVDPPEEESASGPEQVAAVAAAAADDVAAPPVAAGGADDEASPAAERPAAPAPAPEAPRSGTPVAPTPQTPAEEPAQPQPEVTPAEPLLPDPLTSRRSVSLTDGLADGLESVTTLLGDETLGRVSPELGRVVTGTGQLLTDLVRALDGTPPQQR